MTTTPALVGGRAQATTLAVGLAGIPAIAFLSRAVIALGSDGWRIVFLAGGLALFAVPVLARLPESPRWLRHAGRDTRARDVLSQPGGDRAHGALVDDVSERHDTTAGALAALTGRRLRRRAAVLLATWVLAMLGFSAFAAWVPALLAEHGLSLATSLTFSAITAIGAVPGALLARAIADRFCANGSWPAPRPSSRPAESPMATVRRRPGSSCSACWCPCSARHS